MAASAAMREVLDRVDRVAPTDATVLIEGESGVGKELVAERAQRRSRRRAGPFVRVNCAAVPRDLLESEFFGHAKGAFTGAVAERVGRFERADGGTLLLDEIGELDPGVQGKLLRALQERQFERLGESRTRRVDVRVIASTNRDLLTEVRAGRFREDLYYRINVVRIRVPPLRERSEDIPPLARLFLEDSCRRLARAPLALTAGSLARLLRHDWPGNVRELRNVMERSAILSSDDGLRLDLAEHGLPRSAPRPERDERILTDEELRLLERENLVRALEVSGGRIYGEDGAARRIGVPPTTLVYRLKKFRIRYRG